MNRTSFLIPDFLLLQKIFKIEKFLREFSFSSISSLNVLAFYMQVLYKGLLIKKREVGELEFSQKPNKRGT